MGFCLHDQMPCPDLNPATQHWNMLQESSLETLSMNQELAVVCSKHHVNTMSCTGATRSDQTKGHASGAHISWLLVVILYELSTCGPYCTWGLLVQVMMIGCSYTDHSDASLHFVASDTSFSQLRGALQDAGRQVLFKALVYGCNETLIGIESHFDQQLYWAMFYGGHICMYCR